MNFQPKILNFQMALNSNHTQLVGYFHTHIDTWVDIQVQPTY